MGDGGGDRCRDGSVGGAQGEDAALQARLEEARRRADEAERRLLTAQGGELVDEVAAALRHVGFHVEAPDDDRRAAGAMLLEDLQVREGDWLAIVEVRGYGRGAKTSDFQRIERAVAGYRRSTDQEPSARWYIVNHHLAEPPDEPPVLAGAQEDVDVFAEAAGLVVDTRKLFRLRERVASGF